MTNEEHDARIERAARLVPVLEELMDKAGLEPPVKSRNNKVNIGKKPILVLAEQLIASGLVREEV